MAARRTPINTVNSLQLGWNTVIRGSEGLGSKPRLQRDAFVMKYRFQVKDEIKAAGIEATKAYR